PPVCGDVQEVDAAGERGDGIHRRIRPVPSRMVLRLPKISTSGRNLWQWNRDDRGAHAGGPRRTTAVSAATDGGERRRTAVSGDGRR
ncbi:hypothetical protein MHK74_14900, partial [Microbacterium aurum]|uniref:hypothetical protein n=1 Tax=Microbacterium aurum TaxID=36805 RepID=UPI001EF540EC